MLTGPEGPGLDADRLTTMPRVKNGAAMGVQGIKCSCRQKRKREEAGKKQKSRDREEFVGEGARIRIRWAIFVQLRAR